MKNQIKRIASLLCVAILGVTAFSGCTGGQTGEFNPSREINVVTREEGSGTRDAFTELTGVLVKQDDGTKTDQTTNSAVTINSTEGILTNVTSDLYSIGYVSLGSLKDSVKALSIDGVECTAENAKDGSYPIARPFNIATKDTPSEVAQDFIDYILSSDGQAIVSEEGYVTVSEKGIYKGNKPEGKVSVAGSSSISPVMEKLAEAYEEVNPNANIEIQTTDSSSGMKAVMDGTCDIGMASRDLKEDESTLTETLIAKDGIAVIANTGNTTKNISIENVRKIYTGEITVWSDAIA